MRCRVLLAALLIVCAAPLNADRKGFTRAWKGRVVTLKQPLHSITYFNRQALVNHEGSVKPVTIVTPDRGVYYSGWFGDGDVQSDRDPNQLIEKVTALLGIAGPPKLLIYPAGTRMTVKDVAIARGTGDRNRRVWFLLYDEFTTTGQPSTGLGVELPQNISRELTEQGEIERLALTFFDVP